MKGESGSNLKKMLLMKAEKVDIDNLTSLKANKVDVENLSEV